MLEQLPQVKVFNMTDVIGWSLAAGRSVAVFPIHEYWSDVGTPVDLDKARSLFSEKL